MPRVARTAAVCPIMAILIAKATGGADICAPEEVVIHSGRRHVPAQRAAPLEPGGRHPDNADTRGIISARAGGGDVCQEAVALRCITEVKSGAFGGSVFEEDDTREL
eukprot:7388286-Prymnesium_polylepis.1